MAYMALYRKWRPMTFDEVVEQSPVVTVLRNAVISGRIAHAYLFCGTRGTGKTTMAKIFARAVNCLNPQNGSPCNECDVCRNILNQQILDVSEIDAASNNGVDNIRAIIEETAYAASIAKFKVFIIDEVHMLSTGAFNALLKTLEEPPENVIFILATTEPNKLPVTILSRCQRYDFKRISQEGIIGRLEKICKEQELSYELPALALLLTQAEGESVVKDAQDLRNKESDRIKEIVNSLSQIGANIEETEDGFKILGKTTLKGGAKLKTNLDHRLAMTYFMAGLISQNPIEIEDFDCHKTSFPQFLEIFESLKK